MSTGRDLLRAALDAHRARAARTDLWIELEVHVPSVLARPVTAADVVDPVKRWTPGQDSDEMLDVIGWAVTALAVAESADGGDRNLLLAEKVTVLVNWGGGVLDVREPVDEAGAPLPRIRDSWLFTELTPGPVTSQVYSHLARDGVGS